jgi:hypothetical protein
LYSSNAFVKGIVRNEAKAWKTNHGFQLQIRANPPVDFPGKPVDLPGKNEAFFQDRLSLEAQHQTKTGIPSYRTRGNVKSGTGRQIFSACEAERSPLPNVPISANGTAFPPIPIYAAAKVSLSENLAISPQKKCAV